MNSILQNSKNLFVAARGHVQRVIDVALIVSNMSRLAGIIKRRHEYDEIQVGQGISLSFMNVLKMG